MQLIKELLQMHLRRRLQIISWADPQAIDSDISIQLYVNSG
jgi:hypothetical protein